MALNLGPPLEFVQGHPILDSIWEIEIQSRLGCSSYDARTDDVPARERTKMVAPCVYARIEKRRILLRLCVIAFGMRRFRPVTPWTTPGQVVEVVFPIIVRIERHLWDYVVYPEDRGGREIVITDSAVLTAAFSSRPDLLTDRINCAR